MRDIAISVKVVEPIFFGESIHPMFLGNFLAGEPLAESRSHRLQLGHCRSTNRRVTRAVFGDELFHEVRTLQDHATARVMGAEFAKIFQESAVAHGFKNTS